MSSCTELSQSQRTLIFNVWTRQFSALTVSTDKLNCFVTLQLDRAYEHSLYGLFT